jgi:hypothetical protein
VRRAFASGWLGILFALGCAKESPDTATDSGGGAAGAGGSAALACPVPLRDSGPPLGFDQDIFPLLHASCGRFACHNAAYRNRGLFLGESEDEGTPSTESRAEAYASLLALSETAPALRRVEPGDPARSFLMLKLDGCHGALDLDCPTSSAERPCGDRMPPATEPWPAERRDVVRAWIAQGAVGP